MKNKLIYLITAMLLSAASVNGQANKVWSLRECVAYALENNISIKQSELDRKTQDENIRVAKGAFLPNLNASASQGFNFGSSFDAISNSRVSSSLASNRFGLNSSVTLFNGFTNKHTLAQSKLNAQSQDATLIKMKNDISLNVANAYLQVLFTKEQIKIAQAQVEISKHELKRTGELVEAGVRARGDLLNVKSTLSGDEQRLVTAENSYNIAALQLAQLLQLPQPSINIENVNVDAPNQKVLSNTASQIFEKALGTLPEITVANLNIESSKKGIEIAQAAYKPTLSLNAGLSAVNQYNYTREGKVVIRDRVVFVDNSLTIKTDTSTFRNQDFRGQIQDTFGKFFSFSLSIPIFNRYQIKSSVNRAVINHDKAKYTLESEKIRLRETIQRAYTDTKASLKSYEASRKNVEAQKEAFRYAQERFNAGAMSVIDFDQTKNRLFSAESQLVSDKYNYVFRLRILEFYFGLPFTEN